MEAWTRLAPPVGPALGFALARLGESSSSALDEWLDTFARAAAERYAWCTAGFSNAERAFGEERWRRAVMVAAASPAVERVGMWVTHFEPFAAHATDAELFAAAAKLTWPDSTLAKLFNARGDAMFARLERAAAEALAQREQFLHGEPDLAVDMYAHALAHRGQTLPERHLTGVEPLVRSKTHSRCVRSLLRVVAAEPREQLLLGWAKAARPVDLDQELGILAAHATPAIARWLVSASRNETHYFSSNDVARFGPVLLEVLAEVPELAAEPEPVLSLARIACTRHPSAQATALLSDLLEQGATERDWTDEEAALAQQPLSALLPAVRDRWPALSDSAKARFVRALAIRAYEPEARALAAELAARGARDPDALRELTRVAEATWPREVGAFVEAVRALPEAVHARARDIVGAANARKGAELLAQASTEVAAAALHASVVVSSLETAAHCSVRLSATDEGEHALWFFVYCAWCRSGAAHVLQTVVRSAGSKVVAPLLALIGDERARAALSVEGRACLLGSLAELAPRETLDVLASKWTPEAALNGLLRRVLAGIATEPGCRTELVALLCAMLADKARRLLALELLSIERFPELEPALSGVLREELRSRERQLAEQALVLARPAVRVSTAGVAPPALSPLATAGELPVTELALAGTIVAAATSSEVVLWSRSGDERARIPGLAGKRSVWRVGPDGAWVAILDELGVALFRGDGSPVPIQNEDGDDEPARLCPNDGISGVLPLDAGRLLIWAIGHNVYEPLTICDVAAGREIAHARMDGFATDAATWAGCGGFVVFTTAGTIELRSSKDGKRVQSLGRVQRAEDEGWGWLQVMASGATLLVVDERTVTVLQRRKTGKYAVAATLVDVSGTVRAHPGADRLAILTPDRCDVYGGAGRLEGSIELAPPAAERQAALSANGRLAIAEGKHLDVYDLRDLTLAARGALEADVTAIAGDEAGFWIGTAAGHVLHAV